MFLFFIIIFSAFLNLALFLPNLVLAVDEPVFPLCSNPQGEVKVFYPSGIHGVPGDANTYHGVDTVYSLGSGNFLQCFCADSGEGVQTEWWRVDNLSESEIENFRDSGWIYIPDGSVWDLDSSPYLARNSAYSCGESGGKPTPTPTVSSTPTPTKSDSWQLGGPPICTAEKPKAPVITSIKKNGSSATLTWTKVDNATHYTISYGLDKNNLEYGVPNTGNVTTFTIGNLDPNKEYYYVVYAVNDCMPSDPSFLALGESVLGFATTGTTSYIVSMFSFGLTSLSLGLILRKKNDK